MKLFVGMVTFGNLKYTRHAWAALEREIPGLRERETPSLLVVGDPYDSQTARWAAAQGIPTVKHERNWGFAVSVNDILDAYQQTHETAPADAQPWLLLVGNDVVVLPGAIAALIAAAEAGGVDHVIGRQMTSWDLVRRQPALRRWFFDTSELPLREGVPDDEIAQLQAPPASGGRMLPLETTGELQNLYLASPQAAMAIGYLDPNFFPAYFGDNDVVRRAAVQGLRLGMALDAWYLHFLSRARFEAVGVNVTDRYFQLNSRYYTSKWGGPPGAELHRRPFAGAAFEFGDGRLLDNGAFIGGRMAEPIEKEAVEYWRWTPQAFRDRHRGQRCVIAGNGPSLGQVDFGPLANEVVFCLNRGYLKDGLRVSYHVAVDPVVLEPFASELLTLRAAAKFWPIARMPELADLRGDVYGLRLTPEPSFQTDIDRPLYEGHSVAFVALQIAYYMGFTEAILVGFDHRFAAGEDQPPDSVQVTGPEGDANHFTPSYFPPGSRWHAPNWSAVDDAFMRAREAWEADGRQIVNCTPGGHLEIFERADLGTWLAAPRRSVER